jgi:hypothetical protein
MDLATTKGRTVRYRLLNLPHYLAWRIGELVEQAASDDEHCCNPIYLESA